MKEKVLFFCRVVPQCLHFNVRKLRSNSLYSFDFVLIPSAGTQIIWTPRWIHICFTLSMEKTKFCSQLTPHVWKLSHCQCMCNSIKNTIKNPCKNRVCTEQERMEDTSGFLKQVLDSSERSSGLSHPFSLQTHMFQFILLLFPFCECNVQITQLSFWLLNGFL